MESFGTRQLSTLKPEPLVAPLIESEAIKHAATSALAKLVTFQSAADAITAYAAANVEGLDNAPATGSSKVMFNQFPLPYTHQLDIHLFDRLSMSRSTSNIMMKKSQMLATTPPRIFVRSHFSHKQTMSQRLSILLHNYIPYQRFAPAFSAIHLLPSPKW
jgi:hypothetical protein